MGSATEKPAEDSAAYFRDMARHYRSRANVELHEAQSDLFATIAADYSELAETAVAAAMRPATTGAGSFARWILWVGRWRRPVTPLSLPGAPLPAAPTGAE